MGYQPYDDRDDELEQWLSQQASSQRPELEPVPEQGSLASLITPRDAEMDSRWRTAEQGALGRSGYGGNQSYGAGEALRDFAPMAVGSLASLLTKGDRGRSIPNILGAGMEANSQTAKTRQAEAQAAGDFALQARHQREASQGSGLDAAYKQAQIENWNGQRDLSWARVGQRGEQIDLAQAKAEFDRDPSSPQAQQIRALVKQQSGVDIGELGTQSAGKVMGVVGRTQDLQNAGPKAAAQTQATIDTQLANAPAVNANEADKAAGKAAAEKLATNPALDAGGNPLAPPGTSVGAGSYTELAKRNPQAAQKVGETEQDMQAMIQSHSNLTNIRSQIDKLPMSQRTVSDPTFAKLQGDWENEAKRYQTLKFESENRGVPQAFEQKIFDVQVGNPYSWESALKDPLDAAVSARTDHGAMMSGQHEAMLRAQQQFRQKWGFSPQQAQPQAAPTGGGGWGSNVAENLGNTGSRKLSGIPQIPQQRSASVQMNPGSAPPAPAAAGGGGMTFRPSGMPDGSVYVTDPASGKTKRVRREQAMAAGWSGQ